MPLPLVTGSMHYLSSLYSHLRRAPSSASSPIRHPLLLLHNLEPRKQTNMNDIEAIILNLLASIASIKPLNGVANDITDANVAISIVHALDPNLNLAPAQAAVVNVQTLAGKVASGSYALVGTVGASFDGVEDKIVTIAFRQYFNGGAPADSDAAKLKEMLGL